MRIGIFTNCYKPIVNGVVRSICTFRQELIRQGHEVFVFAPEARDHEEEGPGVYRYRAIQVDRPIAFPLAISYSPSMDKLIPELDLDLIHSQHPVVLGSEAARQARRCGIPLVFTYHTQYEAYAEYVPINQRVAVALTREVLRRYLRRCRRIVAPTDSVRKKLSIEYPEAAPRVARLPTPVDLGVFAQGTPRAIRERYGLQREFTFIVVSRLAREKGLTRLVEALSLVAKDRAEVRLLVVGDGPSRESLEQRVRALGLGDRVLFSGMVPFDQVPNYLAAADAFSYASLADVQPLVTVEAMAAGLPVVAIDTPASRDVVVDGENGLLASADARSLGDAMRRVVMDRGLRERLAAGARRTAARYSLPEAGRQLVGIYDEAIRESRGARG